MIRKAWEEQKEIRYATRIFKQYGSLSIEVVKKNPYRLAMDIFGIGFVTADRIAEKLGFAKDSDVRAEAGIFYVLHQLSDEGHVYYSFEPLIEKCQEIIEVEREVITKALSTISSQEKIVIEELSEGTGNKAVYLAKFHFSETSVAERVRILANAPKSIRKIDSEKAVGKGSESDAEEKQDVVTGGITLIFAHSAEGNDTVTRSSGSWTKDGFAVGDKITVAGTADNNIGGGNAYTISAISSDGKTLTLAADETLADLTLTDTIAVSIKQVNRGDGGSEPHKRDAERRDHNAGDYQDHYQ